MRLRKRIDIQETGGHPVTVYALTVRDAAIAAGVGRNSLMKVITSGDLVARKYGTRTLVLPSDLKRWLESLPRYEPLHRIKARNAGAAAADAPAAKPAWARDQAPAN